jgi:HK97 gp10 family phage protein
MADNFKIEGLDQALAKIKSLQGREFKNAVRSAARSAMNIVRDAAKSGASQIDDPTTKASITKNIAVSPGKSRKDEVIMRVGVRGGARLSKDPDSTAHWRLVEFGSEHNQPAHPFMRPALANNVNPVTDKFVA